MSYKERLIELIKKNSFKKTKTPTITLSSGKKSCYYFNLKKVTFLPEGQFLVGRLMYDKVKALSMKPDGIGGLTMGADPVSFATAFTSHMNNDDIQAFAIRKERKPHGMQLQVEGNVKKGDKVIIVDDVVTTGRSTIQAISIARENGLEILCAIVLLDRCEENGKANIEKENVSMHSILNINDFI
jgi:orotate phosphoribosyltransferase